MLLMFKFFCSFFLSASSLFARPTAQIVETNSIQTWCETFGEKNNPPVLLLMGACCQGVLWHEEFCKRLADEGFYVIRYDYRDSGLSTCFNYTQNPYNLMDLTKDAVGLLDALEIPKAHLFGVSMGGFIAEIMGCYFPERVHSLLLLGSSPDAHPSNRAYIGVFPQYPSGLPCPTPAYLKWLSDFMKKDATTEEEKIQMRMEGWDCLNGDKIPLNPKMNREIQMTFLSRLRYPQGINNHFTMLREGVSESLVRDVPSKIQIPTVILHGTEDPIFPPQHGQVLHETIRGSELILVEGMGHIPNDNFYDLYITSLKKQRDALFF